MFQEMDSERASISALKVKMISMLQNPLLESGRIFKYSEDAVDLLDKDIFNEALVEAIIHCGIDYRKALEKKKYLHPKSAEILEMTLRSWESSIIKSPDYRSSINYVDYSDEDLFYDFRRLGLTSDISAEFLARCEDKNFPKRMVEYVNEHDLTGQDLANLLWPFKSKTPALSFEVLIGLLEADNTDKELKELFLKSVSDIKNRSFAEHEQCIPSLLANIKDAGKVFDEKRVLNPIFLMFMKLPISSMVRDNLNNTVLSYLNSNSVHIRHWFSAIAVKDPRFYNNNFNSWLAGIKNAHKPEEVVGISALESLPVLEAVDAVFTIAVLNHLPESLSKITTAANLTASEKLLSDPTLSLELLKRLLDKGREEGLFSMAELMDANADEIHKFRVIDHLISAKDFMNQNKREISDEMLAYDLGL